MPRTVQWTLVKLVRGTAVESGAPQFRSSDGGPLAPTTGKPLSRSFDRPAEAITSSCPSRYVGDEFTAPLPSSAPHNLRIRVFRDTDRFKVQLAARFN